MVFYLKLKLQPDIDFVFGVLTQANRFVNRFHEERKTKLSLILDNERWKQADVPTEFQELVRHIESTGQMAVLPYDRKAETGENVIILECHYFQDDIDARKWKLSTVVIFFFVLILESYLQVQGKLLRICKCFSAFNITVFGFKLPLNRL